MLILFTNAVDKAQVSVTCQGDIFTSHGKGPLLLRVGVLSWSLMSQSSFAPVTWGDTGMGEGGEGLGVDVLSEQFSTLNIAARSFPILFFSVSDQQLQYFPTTG